MLNQKNNNKQGLVGVGFAIAYFATLGAVVSLPITDNQDYDFIIDLNGLKKIQVKTTRYKRGEHYIVSLKVSGKRTRHKRNKDKFFKDSGCDLLFVTAATGVNYLIPKRAVKNNHELTLNAKMQRYVVSLF